MNTFRHSLLIGMTVAGLATASMAAYAAEGRPGDAAGHEQDERHAERMAKHEARLHDKLRLTAAQEPAWKTFISALSPPQRPARMERAAIAKMSAPERLEKWIAFSKERVRRQERRLSALKTFYAVLSLEQKKIFDDNVAGGEHGAHVGHWMHRGQ